MTDRTDQPDPATARGPWPEVSDMTRLFDHGAPWCVNAAGHPDPEGGYPDPNLHVPPHECRTAALWLDDIRHELVGPPTGLAVYAARAFRFGEERMTTPSADTRIAFDRLDEPDDGSPRFSVTLGDALRIAHHLIQLVESIDNPPNHQL